MYIFYLVVTVICGLTFGSFMNVLIYRLPRGMNIATPGSSCPKCKSPVRWYSNIPVISYIFQKGKCIDCGAKISFQYPLVEIITAVVFLLIFLHSGLSIYTIKYCFFAFLLIAAGLTDLFTAMDSENFDSGVIPSVYTIGGVLAGYIWAMFTEPGLYDSFAGSGAGAFALFIPGFLYAMIKGVEGLGDGDALLLAMVGSFLGLSSILFVFTISALLGVVIGVSVVIITKDRYKKIPFGPMISIAAILYIFFKDYIPL